MGILEEIVSGVLDNQGDFFTSGLRNAINNYYETKRMYSVLSVIIGVICLGALFIRALIF